MAHARRFIVCISLVVCISVGMQGQSMAQTRGPQNNIMLRIHSFSMSPGEKIVGATLTISEGSIIQSITPRGWHCEIARDGRNIRCYSQHSSYGISASGRMPAFTISDPSGNKGKSISFEVSVEIETGDGRTYTKQISNSEYSLQ